MINNNNQSSGDEIVDSFSSIQDKNEMAEVLKELFDEGKIYMIGDLSRDEIKLATRIYMIAELKNIKVWQRGLSFYCKLLLSKNRKSRQELLNAISGLNRQSFLNRLNPFNKPQDRY